LGGGGLFILQPNLNCPMAGVRDVSASQLSLPSLEGSCKVLDVSSGIILSLAVSFEILCSFIFNVVCGGM
jgi:hypothetical protein